MGGKLKAALPYAGTTVLERIAVTMAEHCRHIYVAVAADTPVALLRIEETEQSAGVPILVRVDQHAAIGPLGGIFTALRSEAQRADCAHTVWVSAGDMPFVSSAAAALMLAHIRNEVDAAVPHVDGRKQPLQAIYRTQALYRAVAACIDGDDHSMRKLLSQLRVAYLDDAAWEAAGIDRRFVYNVNTPRDYTRALEEEGR